MLRIFAPFSLTDFCQEMSASLAWGCFFTLIHFVAVTAGKTTDGDVAVSDNSITQAPCKANQSVRLNSGRHAANPSRQLDPMGSQF